jgi:hypothetical protein
MATAITDAPTRGRAGEPLRWSRRPRLRALAARPHCGRLEGIREAEWKQAKRASPAPENRRWEPRP